MTIGDAKRFIGKDVTLRWQDRKGDELETVARVYSADFVPLYGPCLLTDAGEVRLDRVVSCELIAQPKIA